MMIFPCTDISSMTGLVRSLIPEVLEYTLTVEEMTDLLAYLVRLMLKSITWRTVLAETLQYGFSSTFLTSDSVSAASPPAVVNT